LTAHGAHSAAAADKQQQQQRSHPDVHLGLRIAADVLPCSHADTLAAAVSSKECHQYLPAMLAATAG
jgi:hypothetical protein